MAPDRALQRALLARFLAEPALLALVPAANIIDGDGAPQRFPSILFGEGQAVREPQSLCGRERRLYATLHVWTKSAPLARDIADGIAAAVEGATLPLEGGHRAVTAIVSSARLLRDPDGETSHGVVTVESLVEVAR